MEKVVVVVEEEEVAKAALRWALDNIVRCGDLVVLVHVYQTSSSSRNKKKLRRLRLKGFQLALSFKDICHAFPNTKTEIVVTEGDEDGKRIASVVTEIGASTLVLGLHQGSFLYRLVTLQNNSTRILNCRVLAIKEPARHNTSRSISIQESLTKMGISQIEISMLRFDYCSNTPDISTLLCALDRNSMEGAPVDVKLWKEAFVAVEFLLWVTNLGQKSANHV